MNLEHLCKQVISLCESVSVYLKDENRQLDYSDVQVKGYNDYVTYVDQESEKRLIKGLRYLLPKAGFLTEEGSVELRNEEYYWVVDPLDGTTNYIHQLSPYAISIALMKDKEILLGCVYEVTLQEVFYAWKGGGAWLNGRPIKVSSAKYIESGVIAHGIPYRIEPKYEYIRDRLAGLYGKCTLRHFGSAASELCYVAAGRLDAYFHDNLSPWDVAAGAIILQEAGGKISDFSNGGNFVFGREVAASNGIIHGELVKFLA